MSVKCAAISVNSRCFETKLLLNYRNESERKREQFRHMINIFTNNCRIGGLRQKNEQLLEKLIVSTIVSIHHPFDLIGARMEVKPHHQI